jgi:hypothetical protein
VDSRKAAGRQAGHESHRHQRIGGVDLTVIVQITSHRDAIRPNTWTPRWQNVRSPRVIPPNVRKRVLHAQGVIAVDVAAHRRRIDRRPRRWPRPTSERARVGSNQPDRQLATRRRRMQKQACTQLGTYAATVETLHTLYFARPQSGLRPRRLPESPLCVIELLRVPIHFASIAPSLFRVLCFRIVYASQRYERD